MKLKDRIASIIGHEIVVNAPEAVFSTTDSGAPDDDMCYDDAVYCEGILEEVGEDYLLIKALDRDKGGITPTGTEYFAHLEWVNTVTHVRDCKKCAVEAAMDTPAGGRRRGTATENPS
ncbi:MAG: hypothetical protein FWF18_04775 [Dehalococcoidia bacterium]|nr:hypothetical protein [Dehalococcoidia bacterium]